MNGIGLFAAIDLTALGILIVFIIIPLIGVIVSKLRELVQPANQAQAGPGDSARIQEQIDEFLRRASQRRGGQPAAEPAAPPAADAEDDAPMGDRMNQQSRKFMDTSEFGRRSEQMGEEVVQADQQFTQQVQQAFSGDVGRLSSRPGESAQRMEVAETETVEAENSSRPTLDALPEAGSGLGELLGSPDNITQAVIMSEILRRPEW